jgi:CrcB protein
VRKLLLVVLGSGFGGGARYLVGGWVMQRFGAAFPYGTLGINALGSFLVVLIVHLSLHTGAIGGDLRLALTTGVMGGFTTYSTFTYETVAFFERGAVGAGAIYLGATVAICLIAGVAGLWVGRLVAG